MAKRRKVFPCVFCSALFHTVEHR